MMNLDDGLVYLKIDVDCVEMATWIVAFREISVYVTNPSEKYVDQLLLGEMYAELRKLWPKCELRELNEVDLKVMEKSSVLLLGWKSEENVSVEQEVVNEVMADIVNEVEVDVIDDVEGDVGDIFNEVEVDVVDDVEGYVGDIINEVEVDVVDDVEGAVGDIVNEVKVDVVVDVEGAVGDIVNEVEVDVVDDVEGDVGDIVNEFPGENDKGVAEFDRLDDLENLIGNDHYDDQWWADIEARFDQDEEGPNTCYNDEVEALEDLGPTWNDGPIEYEKEVFQNSDELVEKDYDYDVEDDDGATSIRKGKKNLVNAPVVGHVLYNKNIHLDNPILLPNMVFGSAAEFRELIRSYSVKTKKGLRFVKNDRWRQQVKCRDEDCRFSVWCSRVGDTNNLAIKTIVDEHICGDAIRNRMVTVKYLARKYVNKIRREPTTTIRSFIGDVNDDIKVEITRTMAWRAIKAAGYLMYGNETQQFAKLWSYGHEILATVPNSTVRIQLVDQKFNRIYICPGPLKEGFKTCCRKFVCLDGCFLKGSFKGQILAVVGLDPNNGIYCGGRKHNLLDMVCPTNQTRLGNG
ncbi:hypothetical protein LIER_10181 [Lithospermum erythrorhizon]|uniref:Transposase MuDR plant domain-containing protein n=1 Tax=Lithospermum erythrorhizon TaxID=34254 RepID=A0AAV3PK14_LITER